MLSLFKAADSGNYLRAQGAAQAVEDGAVLGALLGDLRQKADTRNRLLLYERLRRPRASTVRDLSKENLQIFHMLGYADGGGESDGVLKSFSSSFGDGRFHNDWADVGFRDWLFGHDVVKEAVEIREMEK